MESFTNFCEKTLKQAKEDACETKGMPKDSFYNNLSVSPIRRIGQCPISHKGIILPVSEPHHINNIR